MLHSQNIDPSNANGRRFFLVRWVLAVWHWLVPPTVAHEDRQSSTARMVAAWSLIGLCAVAMGGALVYARPIYGEYKVWKAKGMIKQAQQMRDSGDIVGAVITAGKAVLLTPEFEPAVRLNAEMLTLIHKDQALYFWDKLAKMGTAGLEDQMGHVRALQRTHREKEAALMLEGMLKQYPTDTRLMILGDEVWGKRSSSVQLAVLKDYCAKHPENREIRLRLLKLYLQNGGASPSELSEGFWALADGEDETSIEALRRLVEMDSLLDITSREKLADRIDAHPLSVELDRLSALSIRVAAHPNRKNPLIDEAVSRSKDLKPEQRVPLVRWLVVHREPGRVLSLISESDIKRNENLLNNYLNALMLLGRQKDLERIVTDKAFTMRAAARSFYTAHLALIKGEPRDEVRAKLLAVREELSVGGQEDMLLVLGHYCQDKKFYDVAASAFETASNSTRARIERPAFAAWIECAKVQGDSESFLHASTEAARRWPDDQAFQESALYAKLLAGIDIETSISRADQLLAASPKDSTRKLLAALGYLRLSFIDNSVDICQGIDSSLPSPGQQAVLAAIVHEAGAYRVSNNNETTFRQTLKELIDRIPADAQLLPEEASLLRRAKQ